MSKPIASLVALLVLVLTACAGGDSAGTTTTTAVPPKLRVVVSTSVLADFTRIVGSDYVDVYTMAKAGVDPHGYTPTPSDVGALAEAAVVIKNGAGLDNWVDGALRTSGGRGVLVDTSSGVQVRGSDPHIWHSPQNAKLMVDAIRRALAAADTAHESQYAISQRSYNSQIDGLERDIEQSMEAIESNKLVTHHLSLGYFAAEFGLEYVGTVVPGADPHAVIAPEHTIGLVDKMEAAGVRVVFAEASRDPKAAEAVATAAEVRLASGNEALLVDGLDEAGRDGDTYLEAMRHNTRVLVRHLS